MSRIDNVIYFGLLALNSRRDLLFQPMVIVPREVRLMVSQLQIQKLRINTSLFLNFVHMEVLDCDTVLKLCVFESSDIYHWRILVVGLGRFFEELYLVRNSLHF